MAENDNCSFHWFDENCNSESYSSENCNFDITFRNPTEAYPCMRRASLDLKIVFCVATLFFTLSGLFLKSFIIGFLRSPSETSSTVNHLISIQQFLRITLVVNYIWFGVAYMMPLSLEDLLGGTFCTLFTAFEMFSFFGNIYWSSALAVTRLFYVKFNTFIR
jgi:hypothetical protein